jgi:hypothetical protein
MRRQPWLGAVIAAGILYAFVGVVFAWPASHARFWRLAAWVVSAGGYAAHIVYERVRLRNTPRSGSMHVALGVAIGAFGLAVAANIHALSAATSSEHRRLLLLALAIWPIMTAVPAFLVALAANWVLARVIPPATG